MLDSINVGVAGMGAYSSALKTISNNVANMNTPGFKASLGSFSNLSYNSEGSLGTLSSSQTSQFGTGVSYSNAMLNFKQGDLKATTGDLDLAINGRGFLVLTNSRGERLYARTAQFEQKNGFISQVTTGHKLMIRTSTGNLIEASITGKEVSLPKASTTVKFDGVLSVDSAAVDVPKDVTVYDSLGTKIVLTVTFGAVATTTGTLTEKDVTVTDAKGNVLKSGKVAFPISGGTADASASSLDVEVPAPGGGTSTVKLDFSAMTASSMGSQNAVAAQPADGYAVGSLTTLTVNADGALEATYSNGQKVVLGDVALADFSNLQDLAPQSDGVFQYKGSDSPTIGSSAQAGMGNVQAKFIEGSNVDLTGEFGEMILVQRGFQASSQIISAANEMLGHVFELKGQR